MDAIATGSVIMTLLSVCLMIGIIFGIPMIWYHTGHISRKLTKILKALEK